MGYYDSVKDDVGEDRSSDGDDRENGSSTGESEFGMLREAASENDVEDGDDTEIEVLEEGLETQPKEDGRTSSSEESGGRDQSGRPQVSGVDEAELGEKLDRLIEQNKEIIRVLKSFKS